jgi:hypothetical protein
MVPGGGVRFLPFAARPESTLGKLGASGQDGAGQDMEIEGLTGHVEAPNLTPDPQTGDAIGVTINWRGRSAKRWQRHRGWDPS